MGVLACMHSSCVYYHSIIIPVQKLVKVCTTLILHIWKLVYYDSFFLPRNLCTTTHSSCLEPCRLPIILSSLPRNYVLFIKYVSKTTEFCIGLMNGGLEIQVLLLCVQACVFSSEHVHTLLPFFVSRRVLFKSSQEKTVDRGGMLQIQSQGTVPGSQLMSE